MTVSENVESPGRVRAIATKARQRTVEAMVWLRGVAGIAVLVGMCLLVVRWGTDPRLRITLLLVGCALALPLAWPAVQATVRSLPVRWWLPVIGFDAVLTTAVGSLVLEDVLYQSFDDPSAHFQFQVWRWVLLAVAGLALIGLLMARSRTGTYYYVRLGDDGWPDFHTTARHQAQERNRDYRSFVRTPSLTRGRPLDVANIVQDLLRSVEDTVNGDDKRSTFVCAPNLIWTAAMAFGYEWRFPPNTSLDELSSDPAVPVPFRCSANIQPVPLCPSAAPPRPADASPQSNDRDVDVVVLDAHFTGVRWPNERGAHLQRATAGRPQPVSIPIRPPNTVTASCLAGSQVAGRPVGRVVHVGVDQRGRIRRWHHLPDELGEPRFRDQSEAEAPRIPPNERSLVAVGDSGEPSTVSIPVTIGDRGQEWTLARASAHDCALEIVAALVEARLIHPRATIVLLASVPKVVAVLTGICLSATLRRRSEPGSPEFIAMRIINGDGGLWTHLVLSHYDEQSRTALPIRVLPAQPLPAPGEPAPGAPAGSPAARPPEPRPEDGLVTVVNLTEHAIVLNPGGPAEIRIPPGPTGAARVRETQLGAFSVQTDRGEIPVRGVHMDDVVDGLPSPSAGTLFVVSRLTAVWERNRTDLLFPIDEVRDDTGRITGCRALGMRRGSES